MEIIHGSNPSSGGSNIRSDEFGKSGTEYCKAKPCTKDNRSFNGVSSYQASDDIVETELMEVKDKLDKMTVLGNEGDTFNERPKLRSDYYKKRINKLRDFIPYQGIKADPTIHGNQPFVASLPAKPRYYEDLLIQSNQKPTWHPDALNVGNTFDIGTAFVKHIKHGSISLIYEKELRCRGIHCYSFSILGGLISPSDGIGFAFASRVPCGKNIKRLWSLFVNRTGHIVKRMGEKMIKSVQPQLPCLATGREIRMVIDLNLYLAAFEVCSPGKQILARVHVDFSDIAEKVDASSGYLCASLAKAGITVKLGECDINILLMDEIVYECKQTESGFISVRNTKEVTQPLENKAPMIHHSKNRFNPSWGRSKPHGIGGNLSWQSSKYMGSNTSKDISGIHNTCARNQGVFFDYPQNHNTRFTTAESSVPFFRDNSYSHAAVLSQSDYLYQENTIPKPLPYQSFSLAQNSYRFAEEGLTNQNSIYPASMIDKAEFFASQKPDLSFHQATSQNVLSENIPANYCPGYNSFGQTNVENMLNCPSGSGSDILGNTGIAKNKAEYSDRSSFKIGYTTKSASYVPFNNSVLPSNSSQNHLSEMPKSSLHHHKYPPDVYADPSNSKSYVESSCCMESFCCQETETPDVVIDNSETLPYNAVCKEVTAYNNFPLTPDFAAQPNFTYLNDRNADLKSQLSSLFPAFNFEKPQEKSTDVNKNEISVVNTDLKTTDKDSSQSISPQVDREHIWFDAKEKYETPPQRKGKIVEKSPISFSANTITDNATENEEGLEPLLVTLDDRTTSCTSLMMAEIRSRENEELLRLLKCRLNKTNTPPEDKINSKKNFLTVQDVNPYDLEEIFRPQLLSEARTVSAPPSGSMFTET